jgi:hypothetical protein
MGWHYDCTKDGSVNASDPWYWFCNDTRWRPIATFRDTDADPKERVIFHAAGLAGVGQSSYIDSVILRDLDNAAWTAAASETLDQRRYILQNWRADVVATTQLNGDPSEYVRYSPYSHEGAHLGQCQNPPRNNSACREAEARGAEFACLINNFGGCSTAACRDQLERWINDVGNRLNNDTANCTKNGGQLPVEREPNCTI